MVNFVEEYFIHASYLLMLSYYFTAIIFWVVVSLYKEYKYGGTQGFDHSIEATLTVTAIYSPKIGYLLAALWYS